MEKRPMDNSDENSFGAILIRCNEHDVTHNIHVDKNEFKIGRARDNDEIILDPSISRQHCTLTCEENKEWFIKDTSSSYTFVNGVPLASGISKRLHEGDILQLSTSEVFRYTFTLNSKYNREAKRPRLNDQIVDNNLNVEEQEKEQQTDCKNVVVNQNKKEKSIQTQLLNEKTILEKKLQEMEKALNEEKVKVEEIKNSIAGPSKIADESNTSVDIVNNPTELQIIDTIDLTNVPESPENVEVNKVKDIMEDQLTCSICSELFVRATTLNCMHTFCEYCIKSWNKKRKICPVCRAPVSSMNRSIVIDNFIENILENLSVQLKERRNEIVQERKAMERVSMMEPTRIRKKKNR